MNDYTIKKLDTPRGNGARSMTSLSPTSVHVNFDETGQNWFGPLTPMLPIAPPEVAGRALDYMPGFNLVTEPRANEPVTFAMLRMLADSFDPIRIIIERRKDQMTRQPWTIRLKHEGAGKRPSGAALSPSIRGTIRDIKEFWTEPTFEMSFRQWLRVVLEDHFVIDAPALFCLRNRAGALLELQPVDGGLIKRVINSQGRTPRPIPWDGATPFDWNGLQTAADNWRTQGFKFVNGYLMPPAYQQILHGLPAIDLTTHDLIYRPMNLRSHSLYGFSAIEMILTTINTATRRATSALDYYREGNQPEALFSLPETWTPDSIQRFQDYFDSMYSGNLANRRKMKFIAGGGKSSYVPIKEPALKNEFDEYLIRIACVAFSYSPAAFTALNNRSTSEQHDRSTEEEGLQGTKLFVSDLINDVIANEFDESVEFAWIEEDEVDQAKQSEILMRYAEGGALTLNQVRERLGEEPDPDPAANRLMVKTATGYVPIGAVSKPNIGDEIDT
jgi:hypothetical protein